MIIIFFRNIIAQSPLGFLLVYAISIIDVFPLLVFFSEQKLLLQTF